ncbi:MAG: SUMF1/EgtB/PvdO family nonheme iron enzyme [Deltaproteobacteria bacterium]|nr:SUMF1/EgtB/PvdO family nonheme iron enzyme [Deltaproteobacteria bacterium]
MASELIEEPEEIEVDDAVEEVDLDETEVSEDLEEEKVADDLEEFDVIEEDKETDLLIGDSDEKFSDRGYQYDDKIRKARLLAEEFNNLLGVIDKYYNQYIMIPKGKYITGSKRPKKDEKPEQLVHVSPFYIGKFPVTNALFEIFIEKTGYKTTAGKIGYGTAYYGRSQKTINEKTGLERFTWNTALISKTVKGACWYQPLGPGSTIHNKRNHPVVQVSTEDAIAFAAWTGKNLPTENEWEAASRTAKGYVFPWGNEWKKHSCNIEESYIGDTTPVDKYVEFTNDSGITDTMGNVLEWTRDRSEPPSFVKDRLKYYVVKGGSWISGNELRLFSRFILQPRSHSNILGFRCVAH